MAESVTLLKEGRKGIKYPMSKFKTVTDGLKKAIQINISYVFYQLFYINDIFGMYFFFLPIAVN